GGWTHHGGRQPQRIAGEYRRHQQPAGQRGGHDAPPGESLRGAARGRRWQPGLPIRHAVPGRAGRLMPVAAPERDLRAVALSSREYEVILEKLGREPNHLELGMFGALWSEHCGYKTSWPMLRDVLSSATGIPQGTGQNTGIGDFVIGL